MGSITNLQPQYLNEVFNNKTFWACVKSKKQPHIIEVEAREKSSLKLLKYAAFQNGKCIQGNEHLPKKGLINPKERNTSDAN